jgi:glyoxylase-like metal-dependent hydrolase (beta-lactamase superfamily II)
MPLFRQTFPVGALGCNCTIVGDPETREALVIDPGDEAPDILAALKREGLTAVKIIHTHAHFDHVMATGDVAKATKADVLLHKDDRFLYDNAVAQTQMFGLARPGDRPPPPPTHELSSDESIGFGRREARALHTPGHTPGSLCLYLETAGETPVLFAGDTLFRGSIGRTDLPGGSSETILRSIRERLLTLPDHTQVIPGHGPETTIMAEREDNPFVGKFARPKTIF